MNAAEFSHRLARLDIKSRGKRSARERAVRHLVRQANAATVIRGGKVVGWRMTTGEVVCVKTRYASEDAARLHLAIISAARTDSHRIPVRAYPCPHCRGWHLTSQALATVIEQ